MSSRSLWSFLRTNPVVGLDSCVLIYEVDDNPRYGDLAHTILESMRDSRIRGVTSTVTMLEVLVQPYRRDDPHTANRLYGFLSTYPNLLWIPPSLAIADAAARLRAQHALRTPDALQVATALKAGASGFITNDKQVRKVAQLEVLILDDLAGDK